MSMPLAAPIVAARTELRLVDGMGVCCICAIAVPKEKPNTTAAANTQQNLDTDTIMASNSDTILPGYPHQSGTAG